MSKRRIVRARDIKQGVTLFEVRAFPDRGSASIEAFNATKKPEQSKFGGQNLFVKNGPSSYHICSLGDRNIPPNHYNFHKLFFKRKHAEAYVERMKSGFLSSEERVKNDQSIERHNAWMEFDQEFRSY